MARYLPHGTTMKINGVLIGGLVSIGLPGATRGIAETTDSNSNFDRTFLPGLRDGGNLAVSYRHDPEDAGQEEIEDNFNTNGASAVVACLITLPSSATSEGGARTYAFNGFVSAAPKSDLMLVDEKVAEHTVTIQVTGAVTITGGLS